MIESKRNLIFVPELSATTFLFFYYEGDRDSRSYSLRDYSQPGFIPPVRYAKEFFYTAGEILDLSARAGNHCFPGPKHRTDDLSFWHKEVAKLNAQYLARVSPHASPAPVVADLTELQPLFPVLNVEQLNRHPKAQKRGDLRRIFASPNSEDYVTWNVFQLLQKRGPVHWWPRLIALAEQKVPGIASELDVDDIPEVTLWDNVSFPAAYERASRERMRQSSDPAAVRRSHEKDPVEGASEIDITLKGRSYLIYIEAKLHHDISTRTVHDAERDQISRNIDCLLESCGDRRPFFWMIVRDDGPGWLYTQRLNLLRTSSSEFLPHRPRQMTGFTASRTALFLWHEILGVATDGLSLDGTTDSVNVELRKRLGLIPSRLRPHKSTAEAKLEDSGNERGSGSVSGKIMGNGITEPGRGQAAVIESAVPPIGGRKCACGCGLPVMKYAYVWGHKSRSRVNTIPMTAKDVAWNGAIPNEYQRVLTTYNAVATQRTTADHAISQMHEQIGDFVEKIEKLKEAIEILQQQERNR